MRFTVIIATCGRPDRLSTVLRCVNSAINESGESHRIIVADNSPELCASETVQAFREDSSVDVTYLESEPLNKSVALNKAIAAAETDWLAFTDDDTEPTTQWLAEAGRFASTQPVRVFGGCVLPGPLPNRIPRTLGKPAPGKPYPGGGVFVQYQPQKESGVLEPSRPAPIGANVFIRRDLFDDVGNYDEDLWFLCGKAALGVDDGEFGVRLKKSGEPIGYCREALVVHPVHVEKMALLKRMIHWYRFGWRDPVVFHDELPATFARYSAKGALQHACLALVGLLKGNLSIFGDEMVISTRRYGMMCGRLSSAYRKVTENHNRSR